MSQQIPITIKIDATVKAEAQKLAKGLGLSLSSIIENKLREAIVERRVVFTENLEPTTYLEKVMSDAEQDIKHDRNITHTNTKEEAMSHLKSLM